LSSLSKNRQEKGTKSKNSGCADCAGSSTLGKEAGGQKGLKFSGKNRAFAVVLLLQDKIGSYCLLILVRMALCWPKAGVRWF
jgi:hypothetical protein